LQSCRRQKRINDGNAYRFQFNMKKSNRKREQTDAAANARAIKLMGLPQHEVVRKARIALEKIKLKKTDWRFYEIKAGKFLDQWRELAKTDAAALRALAGFLLLEGDNLKRVFLENPKHFYSVTLKASSWPGEITLDKDLQEQQDLYARALCLGRFSSINYGKKQWSRKTPEITAVLQLIKLMRRRGNLELLPPLNRKTAGEWWQRAQPFFEALYGKDFENHKQFVQYWKNVIYKDRPNARALIRRDIKKQMKQAFRSIAPKSDPL
jgi:hypothetical protein